MNTQPTEPSMSKDVELKFGDRVHHDFSKNRGVIIDFRNDPQGYKWKVCFQGRLGETLGTYTDWFKRDVLVKGWEVPNVQ